MQILLLIICQLQKLKTILKTPPNIKNEYKKSMSPKQRCLYDTKDDNDKLFYSDNKSDTDFCGATACHVRTFCVCIKMYYT